MRRASFILLGAVFFAAVCGRAEVYFTNTNAVWKLFKGRSEASSPDATSWRQPGFNDSAWSDAPAPVYYTSTATEPPFYNGGPVIGTVLNDMLNSYTCVFLRKTFTVTNPSAIGSVMLEAAIDDGFIFWLNGVEIARTNMPSGFVAYSGRALASAAEPVPVQSFVIPNGGTLLVNGANVLSAQCFNWDPTSSDFGFMAGLSSVRNDTPSILTQPQDQIVALGATATFRVQAGGNPPLFFQWWFNDNSLAGRTNTTLVLTNIQSAQAGRYSVVVSNSFGSVTSSPAALIIGSCATPPGDLAAWWQLNGSGKDIVGAADLTFSGGPGFSQGKVGQGISMDGVNDSGRATASADLDIGAGPGLSIEGWINPVDPSRTMDIVEWNNGAGAIGLHMSTTVWSSRDFYANLVDTAGISHQAYSGPGALTDHAFQHIALSYEKTSGLTAMYVNGNQVAQTNLGIFTPETRYDFYLGTRPSGVAQGLWFWGVIDELSLYRRALSASEVRAIYTAGFAGKCTTPQPLAITTQPQNVTALQGSVAALSVVAQGTAPLQYQWFFNDSPLGGANQSTLRFPSLQPQQGGVYSVVVSDISGSVTSSPAILTVILPLSIVTQPENAMAVVGGTADFSVAAQGSGTLTYQWYFNNSPLPGMTSSHLLLQNVQAQQAGRYFATVSDASHSVISSPAVLNVLSAWGPVITEFMAQNDGAVLDEDGDAPDWIEIFNPGPDAVNLQDWSLTDDPFNLTKWRFPPTNLAVNGFMLVFASGKNRVSPGAPLHTSFHLDAGGGYVALVLPDGVAVANEFAYPSQHPGVSFGLGGGWVYFLEPTPAVANGLGVLGFVKDTKFSTNRGFFFAPVDVIVSCATPGATISYTINGDEPTLATGVQVPAPNSTSAPQALIHIAATTTLRAAAFKDGYVSSGVDTHSYIFPAAVAGQTRPTGASSTWIEDPPGDGQSYPADFAVDASVVNNTQPGYSFTNALTSLPTLSVVTPMDGIFGSVNGFYTHPMFEGTNWERRASVELIYPDGREGFHVGAGVKIHGAVSRLPHATPKHPLRLLFREEYGPTKLHFPLFAGSPVDTFDQLVLRACSTDSWPIVNTVDFLWYNYDATYQRDQWMRDAQVAMGHASARGIYVQLYLNGLYWGLYNLTERLNDSLFADYLGGDKEDYDVVTDFTGAPVSGDRAAWTQLLQVASRAPSDPTAFWEAQGLNVDGTHNTNFPVLVNLDNFIDYMMLHIYAAAIDFPGRNWWAARRRGADSDGFHFFVWDQEIALDRLDRVTTWGNSPANIEAYNEPNTPGQVYDGLRRDPEFKLRFADRLQKHLFNGGALTVQSNIARWADRAAEIDHGVVGESARWGDAHHTPAYTRQTDWLRMSNFTENVYFPSNHFRAWQRLKNVGLYPTVGPASFNQFGGNVPGDFQLAMTHTNATGTIYYTVDGSDPRLRGGAVAPGALTYAQPITLLSPTFIRARVRSGTIWSAIVEAEFYPPQDLARLQLSELMYNPPKFGSVDGDEVEFLELKNIGSTALDLSGLTFTHGINFTFTNETLLGPGQYFVLARNAAQFAARYPGAPLNGLYTGKLDNNGENLALATALGATVWSVTYNNAAPWPAEADNSGLSLQRMNFTLAVTNAVSWIAAAPTPGRGLPPELIDSDGDGMPDGWEQMYGFSKTSNDANDDADLDGLTNYQEFLAGTNPRDPADRLLLQPLSATSTSSNLTFTLGFNARSNKTYTIVYRNTAAGTGWTNLVNVGFAPTNRFITVRDVLATNAPVRFYRVATPRLP